MNEQELGRLIVNAAFQIHESVGGAGLDEIVYRDALAFELQKKFLASLALPELVASDRRYAMLERKWKADVELFRPENVPFELRNGEIVFDGSPEEMVERQKQTLRDAVPDATGERGTEIYDPSVGVGPTAGPYAGVDEDGNTLVAPLAGRGSYEGGDDGQEALDEEELKGMQKKDLLKLAEKRGVEADDKMTNDEIRNKLLGK